MTLDRVEVILRKDQVVARELGEPMEVEAERSPLLEVEAEDLPPVDVQGVCTRAEVSEELNRVVTLATHDLHLDAGGLSTVGITERREHRDLSAVVGEQPDSDDDARQRSVHVDGHVDVPRGHGIEVLDVHARRREVGEPEPGPVHDFDRKPDELRTGRRRAQLLEGELEIRMV
jgi:hypothetical protein